MISSYLKKKIELVEEHSARLKPQIRNWRQRKETLSAREKNVINADVPIVAPKDIKPQQHNIKKIRAVKEKEGRIKENVGEERRAHRAKMNEINHTSERLAQAEIMLDKQIEEEKALVDAQLEKIDAELEFVSSLLSHNQ